MVEQPIQRCRCCRRVTEDRSPFSWHFITGHNDAFLFVACRYQLKKQLPLQRCERNVPQLIEDEQFGLVNIPYFFIKCTCVVSFFHLFHQPGHGIETNRKASLQGKLSQHYAQVCLSDPGWTNQDHVFTTDNPPERDKLAYLPRIYRWLERHVESVHSRRKRKMSAHLSVKRSFTGSTKRSCIDPTSPALWGRAHSFHSSYEGSGTPWDKRGGPPEPAGSLAQTLHPGSARRSAVISFSERCGEKSPAGRQG